MVEENAISFYLYYISKSHPLNQRMPGCGMCRKCNVIAVIPLGMKEECVYAYTKMRMVR